MTQPAVFAHHREVMFHSCGLYQDRAATREQLRHWDPVPSHRIYDLEEHLIPYLAETRLGITDNNWSVTAIHCFQQHTPEGELELVVYIVDRPHALPVGSPFRGTYPDAVMTAQARAFTHGVDAIFEVCVPLPDVVDLPFVDWVLADEGDSSFCSWHRPGYGPPLRHGPPQQLLKMSGVRRWLGVVGDARRMHLQQLQTQPQQGA